MSFLDIHRANREKSEKQKQIENAAFVAKQQEYYIKEEALLVPQILKRLEVAIKSADDYCHKKLDFAMFEARSGLDSPICLAVQSFCKKNKLECKIEYYFSPGSYGDNGEVYMESSNTPYAYIKWN